MFNHDVFFTIICRFRTPIIDGVGHACLTFYYHMYGDSIGSLLVESTNHTGPAWVTVTGNQGDQWIQHQVTIDLVGGERVRHIVTVQFLV